MFLVGGPAFSGTTLLALLLNQGSLVCLDEPDFHHPDRSERGIRFLKTVFPDRTFLEQTAVVLTYQEAMQTIRECERTISPFSLGVKECDWYFLDYAKVYKASAYPVIAIVRDIRDALVRPLPDWLTEAQLNERYRRVWESLDMFDLWLRYEDLVTIPERVMATVSQVLGHRLEALHGWHPSRVHPPMIKLDRHELLKSGRISTGRVGIWRASGKVFSNETLHTATMMGY